MSAPSDVSSNGGFSTGAALFTFDADKRVTSWNRAAEEATGIAAEDVVGRYCWEVLCAHDDSGGMVCHAGCSFHRLLSEHYPVSPPVLVVRTAEGTRRFRVPMIASGEPDVFVALLVDPGEASQPKPAEPVTVPGRVPALTERQQTVLEMLAEGKQARRIAGELHLSEMTVRNHIRAILRELGCRSQLSAVAEARRLGLV